jgi:2-isopropylmalate synthase
MKPEMIGKRTELVLGKHSGKHATKVVLGEMGFRLSEEQQLAVLQRIKALADKQKKVSREDIVAIAMDVTKQLPKREQKIRLEEFSVTTGNKAKPTASVRLVVEGKAFEGKGVGVGPVDALSKAIQSVLPFKIKLKEYNLKAITGGTDALADVVIQVEDERGNVFDAEAVNEDVIVASANALILGCNLALESAERKRK